jgi:predicted HicB family RNase H-like nuclease
MSNYPLRLPETPMEDAREMADAQGVSINQFLSTLIAERSAS